MDGQSYAGIVQKFPPAGTAELREEISSLLQREKIRIVVLDDDPTGIQTVQDCLLLTKWDPGMLDQAFRHSAPLFYILTNSRSLGEKEAVRVNTEAMRAVLQANREYSFRLIVVSRSDSTLRGHFPAEPEALLSVMGTMNIPMELPVFFVPALFEAGRCTVGNVHYIRTGDRMVPVSETEFAGDSVFGYSQSDLSRYIMEKSHGRIPEDRTGTIPLDVLRQSGPGELQELIGSLGSKRYVSVDALEYSDLRKFSLALLQSVSRKKGWAVLRSSSSLPKALSGIGDRGCLARRDLSPGPGKGMFVIGSHVKKTTRQLTELLTMEGVRGIEADVERIIATPDSYLEEMVATVEKGLGAGDTPVVYTSRKERLTSDPAQRLPAGRKISGFLSSIVRSLDTPPSYLVAKGGITSHDILVGGLQVDLARVAGQVIPGVPAIITGGDHAFPAMPFIIFPGNVGEDHSLAEVYRKMDQA